MKKIIIEVFSLTVVMLVALMSVNATWEQSYDLKGGITKILADNVGGELHSTLRSLSLSQNPINVQNDIKRISGSKWTTRASRLLIVTETNKNYHLNADLSTKAVTRSYWKNKTSGSTLNCNLYIDPGYMAD